MSLIAMGSLLNTPPEVTFSPVHTDTSSCSLLNVYMHTFRTERPSTLMVDCVCTSFMIRLSRNLNTSQHKCKG
jgi:hypothetical protein